MPMLRTLIPLLVLASVGVPAASLGAPVVVHGPDDDAVSAATLAKEVFGSRDFVVAGGIVSLVGEAPESLTALGVTLTGCGASKPGDFAGALGEATSWVDQMEYGAAIRALDGVVTSLPCGGGDASAEQLFEAWFLRGIAAFNDGDTEAAKESFARATTLDPSRKWDEAFPPTPKPVYLEALQETLSHPPVIVQVGADGVVIDGKPVARGASASLRPGEHVLTQDGAVFTLQIGSGGAATVTTAGAVADGVLSGSELGAAWLAQASARRGWDEVLVVDGKESRRFRGGAWVREARSAGPQGPAPLLVGGLATAGAGVGILVGGVGANVAAWNRAALSEDRTSTPLTAEEYASARTQSQAGTALIVAGATTVAVGAGLTAVALVTARGGGIAVLPSFGASPDGVSFGLSGRF